MFQLQYADACGGMPLFAKRMTATEMHTLQTAMLNAYLDFAGECSVCRRGHA